ncbi:MAG: DoxX family protein [Gemmatimonadota bacterium]
MSRNAKRINRVLWTTQALLALLFLFAGGMKLVLPLAALQQGPIALPGAFLKFIGVAECLGALGLVLPGLFRIHLKLTAFAAAGLVVIMAGASTLTALTTGWPSALVPLTAGALALVVCLARGGRALTLGRVAVVAATLPRAA